MLGLLAVRSQGDLDGTNARSPDRGGRRSESAPPNSPAGRERRSEALVPEEAQERAVADVIAAEEAERLSRGDGRAAMEGPAGLRQPARGRDAAPP